MLVPVHCANCKIIFYRSPRRFNEAVKFGWNQFCSKKCLYKNRTTLISITCARPGCGKLVMRQPSQIIKYGKAFCSRRCSAIVSNLSKVKKMRVCPNCRGEFTGPNKYCSKQCIPIRKTQYTKEKISNAIRLFVKNNFRIPLKREMWKYSHEARNLFGTWNNAIRIAGFDPNPVMFAKRHIAQDGHECDSFSEKIIDDWLFKRRIKHRRSVPYPGNNKFTCDFVIGRHWIEFFGLRGEHKTYDNHLKQKIKLAKKFNLKFVEIYPEDLISRRKLSGLLSW